LLGCERQSKLPAHLGGVLISIQADEKMKQIVRQLHDGIDTSIRQGVFVNRGEIMHHEA
jgi:hypothetical protein